MQHARREVRLLAGDSNLRFGLGTVVILTTPLTAHINKETVGLFVVPVANDKRVINLSHHVHINGIVITVCFL